MLTHCLTVTWIFLLKGASSENAVINRSMELIKYRDAGMNTYTWFWVDGKDRMVSPFFTTEAAAMQWLEELSVPDDSE